MDNSQSITPPAISAPTGARSMQVERVLRTFSLVDTRRRSDRGCFSLVCWSVSYARATRGVFLALSNSDQTCEPH